MSPAGQAHQGTKEGCAPHTREGAETCSHSPEDQAPVHGWDPGAQRTWSALGGHLTLACKGPGAPRVLPDCSDPLSGHSSLSLKGVGSQRQAG